MTGLHSVSDIFCTQCTARLGWKYLEAFENRCAFARAAAASAPRRPLRWPAASSNHPSAAFNSRTPCVARCPQPKVQGGQIHRGEVARGRGGGPLTRGALYVLVLVAVCGAAPVRASPSVCVVCIDACSKKIAAVAVPYFHAKEARTHLPTATHVFITAHRPTRPDRTGPLSPHMRTHSVHRLPCRSARRPVARRV